MNQTHFHQMPFFKVDIIIDFCCCLAWEPGPFLALLFWFLFLLQVHILNTLHVHKLHLKVHYGLDLQQDGQTKIVKKNISYIYKKRWITQAPYN